MDSKWEFIFESGSESSDVIQKIQLYSSPDGLFNFRLRLFSFRDHFCRLPNELLTSLYELNANRQAQYGTQDRAAPVREVYSAHRRQG